MGDTTLTIDEDVKERLDEYRFPTQESWNEWLEWAMAVLPTPEEFSSGCDHCDLGFDDQFRPQESSFIIEHYYMDDTPAGSVSGQSLWATKECVREVQDSIDHQFPSDPDTVRVGGMERFVSEFGDARFFLDGKTKQVTIGVPNAFNDGYVGEPLYIEDRGEWTNSFTITDIYHEEGTTTLELGMDHSVESLHHPDEDKATDFAQTYSPWAHIECGGCDNPLDICLSKLPAECPECETVFEQVGDVTFHMDQSDVERMKQLVARAEDLTGRDILDGGGDE